ncbi:MAG: STM3941 family protein, partial [Flavobacteriaceae bacterium]
YTQIIGVLSILFFGLSVFSIIGKNHLDKAILEITEKGIRNRHSVWREPIFIEWKDMVIIERKKILNSKFLTTYIGDVDAYIQKKKKTWFKLNHKLTTQLWKTPCLINTGLIVIPFEELKRILQQKIQELKATFLDLFT